MATCKVVVQADTVGGRSALSVVRYTGSRSVNAVNFPVGHRLTEREFKRAKSQLCSNRRR